MYKKKASNIFADLAFFTLAKYLYYAEIVAFTTCKGDA